MRFEARPRTVGVLALVATLALALPCLAIAAEAPETTEAAESAAAPARTVTAHGVTITWNLNEQRYESPAAEDAVRLAEELRELLTKKLVDKHQALAPAEGAEERVLANGTVMRRVDAELLSTSVVRIDETGELAGGACVDAQDAAARLAAPLATNAEEER